MAFKNININTEDLLIFNINSESKIQINKENQENINFGIGNDIQNNLEEGKIRITLFIQLEKNKDNFATFEITTFFQILNKEKYLINFEEELLFHPQLITTLVSISYSTARGIVLEKLKNTFWKDLILPIISPIKLLQNNQ